MRWLKILLAKLRDLPIVTHFGFFRLLLRVDLAQLTNQSGPETDSAGVSCRFHDLRHTGCTRMLEAGVPLSVVATIMGWSPSATVRMASHYGHVGQTAQRLAVNALNQAGFRGDGAQNWAQSDGVNPSPETRF